MALIFISHSSEDNEVAKEIFDILLQVSKSIFLDYDADHGIKGGEKWEKTLYKRVKKARIMIVALSPNWLNSQWCYKEYCMARVLRKKIIPVVIEKDDRIEKWDGKDLQHYDTTTDSEALQKLKKRIEELTFHEVTKLYDVKDISSPYPGLRSFDKNEAGIFYGRNDEILEVIDILNALYDSGEQKFINIVGASGVGKSSFLKAGVLPLLELLHNENWYVLPTFRALQEILLNFAKTLSIFDYKTSEVLTAFKGDGYKEFFDKLELDVFEKQNKKQQKILFPIDQAEEILNSENNKEKEQFFKIIKYLLEEKSNFIIIWTLRSDQLNIYQAQKELEFLRDKEEVYLLNPIASSELKNIIQEPAFTCDITIQDEVVEAIKEDIKTTTSLPLLAYLLQILYKNIILKKQKIITIDNYKALAQKGKNPIENIINKEADEIYKNHKNKKEIEELFINHLVKINQDESFSKKAEKLRNIPINLHHIIDKFVQKRLLIKDTDKEEQITVEIVHEAMLNSWDTLQKWLNNQKEFLLLKAQLAIFMKGWGESEEKEIPLLTGLQLQKAIEYKDRLIDKEELEYVERSIKKNEAIKRRRFLAVSGSFAVVSALGGLSAWKWGEASKNKQKALEELEKAEHNIGLAYVEKAEVALKQNNIVKAHLYAYSALLKLKNKYDITNAKANAKSIIMSYDNRAIATQKMHKDSIESLIFSPCQKYIASVSKDRTIKIWDVKSFKEIATLKGHKKGVATVAYSPDGQTIISGSYDNTIKIWDVKSFKEIATLKGHKKGVTTVAYSPDGQTIISGSYDNTVKIWDAKNFRKIATLRGHKDSIISVIYLSDNKTVISISKDGILKVWDIITFKKINTLKISFDNIFSVDYSPNSEIIISGISNHPKMVNTESRYKIKIIDIKYLKEIITLNGHKDIVTLVAYSPNGKYIVSASKDMIIKIWDTKKFDIIATIKSYNSNITSVVFSLDNVTIFTGLKDGAINIWCAESLRFSKNHHISQYSLDGKNVFTNLNDNEIIIEVWNAKNFKKIATLKRSWTAEYSPDGKKIISGIFIGNSLKITIWDAKNFKKIATLKEIKLPIDLKDIRNNSKIPFLSWVDNSIVIDYKLSSKYQFADWFEIVELTVGYILNGEIIVSSTGKNNLKMWDAKSYSEIGILKDVDKVISLPNSELIITLMWTDNCIKIWNAKSLKKIATLNGHTDRVTSVSYSPDGKNIISSSWDGTIKIWDVKNFKEITTLKGHKDYVLAATYTSHGKNIISISDDDTIKIWDTRNFKNIATLKGNKFEGYSADNKFVMTISRDKILRVWDAKSFKEIVSLRGVHNKALFVVFSPDGRTIVNLDDNDNMHNIEGDEWDREQFDKLKIWDMQKLANLDNPHYIKQNIKRLEQFLQAKLDGITLKDANIPPLSTKESYPKHHPFHWIDDAESGDAEAMYQLGLIYDRDNQNQKALEWYKKASAKGHKEAKEQLAFLEEWMEKHKV